MTAEIRLFLGHFRRILPTRVARELSAVALSPSHELPCFPRLEEPLETVLQSDRINLEVLAWVCDSTPSVPASARLANWVAHSC